MATTWRFSVLVPVPFLLLAACQPAERDSDYGVDGAPPPALIDAASGPADAQDNGFIDAAGNVPDSSVVPPDPDGVVYGHSSSMLYKIDPETFAVTEVAPFHWAGGIGFDQMTDIAIDKHGQMIGVSFGKVYRVDPVTAECTMLAPLDHEFNGLSFVPAAAGDPIDDERLVGTTLDGSVWRIDPMTGASTMLGNYGGDLTSSGDIVFVDGFGAVATVKHANFGPDFLVSVDPTTFAATLIGGGTGFSDIWGLGFWKGKVFGFSGQSQFLLIDATTGAASLLAQGSNVTWWGAGVTTAAPVIP